MKYTHKCNFINNYLSLKGPTKPPISHESVWVEFDLATT